MKLKFSKTLAGGILLGACTGAAFGWPVTLNLLTDNFPSETSFQMIANDFGGADVGFVSSNQADPGLADGFADGGDLIQINTAYIFDWDLAPGSYSFTIFDSFGDGICCGFGNGDYSLDTPSGTIPSPSGGAFGSSETIDFSIAGTPPTPPGAGPKYPVALDLLTDQFAGETSFGITIDPADLPFGGAGVRGLDLDFLKFVSANPADPGLADGVASPGDLDQNNTNYNFQWLLPQGDYLFTINDSFGDGICCGFGSGDYTLSTANPNASYPSPSGGAFGSSESISFSVPEAGSMALLGLGLAGLGAARRRRKAA
jgi:hypothetical protein